MAPQIAEVAAATTEDVNRACESARKAFENGWGELDPHKRSEIMYRIADVMKCRLQELAEFEAMDAGKPLAETIGFDIPFSIYAFEYFANICKEIHGDVIPVKNGLNRGLFDFTTHNL